MSSNEPSDITNILRDGFDTRSIIAISVMGGFLLMCLIFEIYISVQKCKKNKKK